MDDTDNSDEENEWEDVRGLMKFSVKVCSYTNLIGDKGRQFIKSRFKQ